MAEIKGDNLINKVIFQVDKGSFNDCLNKIRKLKAEMKSFSKSCGNLGKGFGGFNVIGKEAGKVAEKMARAQARISAARIKQATAQMTAQNKELQSMRKFYREQEKLSARAAKQAAGIQASRRVQAVAGLTAKNPELAKMRAYYQQQEKASSRLGNAAVVAAAGRKNRIMANNERMTGMFDGQVVAQFQRRMQSLNAKYQKGAISLGVYNARMAILRKEMSATAAAAQKMTASLNFSSLGAGINGLNTKLNGLMKGIAGLGMAGGYALQRMISGSMDAAATQNKTYFGLLAQNNDDKAMTSRQMDFINRMSGTYGLDKASTGLEYMKFAGSTKKSMSEDQRQQLFESLSIQATAVGMDSQAFAFSIKALSQMSGKGKVALEELRQQLGDHLPSAVQDFYEAWKEAKGKSSASMNDFYDAVKKGDVKLEELAGSLSKIWGQAKNTQAFAQAMNTPERAMQRMKNSLSDLQIAFMGQVNATDGVTTLSEHLIDIFNELSAIFKDSEGNATAFGSKVGEVLKGLLVDAMVVGHYIKEVFTTVKAEMDNLGISFGDLLKVLLGLKIITSVTSGLLGFVNAIKALGAILGVSGIGGAGAGAAGAGATGAGAAVGGAGLALGSAAGVAVGAGAGIGAAKIGTWMREKLQAGSDWLGEKFQEAGLLTSEQNDLAKAGAYNGGYINKGGGSAWGGQYGLPVSTPQVTAPLSGWRDASLSTRLPTTPATASMGNKVQINQQQVIKFDDNKLEGLIKVVASEVTASSMGDMIDLINGGTESTRE
ncbi:TPA: tape measure protein [Escherichia coli]|nr:tape measure protein [Escherichia coli]